jgi:hypothetical protein
MPDFMNRRVVDREPLAPVLPATVFRDRVVRLALAEGLVTREEVDAAWAEFAEADVPRGARLWRHIAYRRPTSREALYSLAARIYGFEEVGISVSDVIAFVRRVKGRFSEEQWKEMSSLRIVPIGFEDVGAPDSSRMLFACSDPMRIEVNNFLSTLSVRSFVLRYASSTSVDYVLDRVLPVLFSSTRPDAGRIFGPSVRLVPLDPLRKVVEERGGYRRAA